MNVNGSKPPDNQKMILGAQRVGKPESKDNVAEVSKAAASPDRVHISVKAMEMVRLKALVADLPEIRQDKIDAARDAIRAGMYRIDSVRIAQRLMNEQ